MSRKKVYALTETRQKFIKVRVSNNELFQFNNLAKEFHFGTVSNMIRSICLTEFHYQNYLKNKELIIATSRSQFDKLFTEYHKQGVNLNQLTKTINMLNKMVENGEAPLSKEVYAINKMLGDIWRMREEMFNAFLNEVPTMKAY